MKIEFTDEQNLKLASLSSSGKSLEEIVKLFNEMYDVDYSLSTIFKQIKSLGLERKDKRSDNVGTKVYDVLDRMVLIRLMEKHLSNEKIAKKLGTTVKNVEYSIKKHGISYRDIEEYKNNGYIADLRKYDMRSLKSEVRDKMNALIMESERLKKRGVEVIPNAAIVVDGSKLKIDLFVPALNRGYVCSMDDPQIAEEDSDILKSRKIAHIINKRCKMRSKTEYKKEDDCPVEEAISKWDSVGYDIDSKPVERRTTYDGLYINAYSMLYNQKDRKFDIKQTVKQIVDEIVSLVDKGYKKTNMGGSVTEKEIRQYEQMKGLVEVEEIKCPDVPKDFICLMSDTKKETLASMRKDPNYVEKKYGFKHKK